MRANNLTLLTDLYELTMMQGYFKNPTDQTVVFDMFYRDNPCGGGFAICAGLEQVIEYIENLRFTDADIEYLRGLSIFEEDFLEYLRSFHFTGDIYAIPEGTVIFPREPMVKVVAPIMEAQLVETAILNIMNHQSLIATKAARVCYAAKGDGIMEFGLRRAQGPDAGIFGARAAVIGGRISTGSYKDKDGKTIYTTDVIVEEHEFAQNKDSGAGADSSETPKTDKDGFMEAKDGENPFD